MTRISELSVEEWADRAIALRAELSVLPLEEIWARREQASERIATLTGYVQRGKHVTAAQAEELEELVFTQQIASAVLDSKDVDAKRAKLEAIKRDAADPANREQGWDDGTRGTPALARQPGTRLETAAETVRRADPWAAEDTSAAGYVARAHTALETVSERLTHDGAELLAQAISERLTLPGITVRRSRDERAEAAALILSLSNPFYESAMRSVIRNPGMFGAGMGHMLWSDQERAAMHDVMANPLARAAFAETSGAAGAYALPLQLDPSIVLTNAGVAGPGDKLPGGRAAERPGAAPPARAAPPSGDSPTIPLP